MTNANPYQAPQAELTAESTQQYYEPKIFALNGRIGRVQYILYNFVTGLVMTLVGGFILGVGVALSGGESPILAMSFTVALYVAIFAYAIILVKRRLNDVNRTGWLSVLIFLPIINLFLIVYLWFARGDEGENNYGLPSKKSSNAIAIVVVFLVGTAVIGILAAIALPAYQQYTERAAQSQAQ